MSENFDDFARQHGKKRAAKERLQKETGVEWEVLQSFTAQHAADGKSLGSANLRWEQSISGRPMLVLGHVAAIFLHDGMLNGVPQHTRIRFTRRPAGHGQAYIDDHPLGDVTWSLEPEVRGDEEFVWCVVEQSKRYTAAELAEAVAMQLGQYHIDYEGAFGREA